MLCPYKHEFGTDFGKAPYCKSHCANFYEPCHQFKIMTEKIDKIKNAVKLAEDWCKDQSTKIPESQICMAALKDIRRIIKGE